MAAAVIMDFQKVEILTVCPPQGSNMRHRAKFDQNWPNSYGELAI